MKARLMVCASCEWIYQISGDECDCPKCGFLSYGALSTYGRKAYRYHITQKPWLDKKLKMYKFSLMQEIKRS